MAIDRQHHGGQLACKVVQLRKCHIERPQGGSAVSRATDKPVGNRVRTAKLWKEVELLKELSHVSQPIHKGQARLIHDSPI